MIAWLGDFKRMYKNTFIFYFFKKKQMAKIKWDRLHDAWFLIVLQISLARVNDKTLRFRWSQLVAKLYDASEK